mgnify:CR=1 FL=1
MYVIGTAGHVDHGKSTLIKNLTNIDPDRLIEEKKRKMTIELGFAWFNDSNNTIGIIDVPGHEELVDNMIKGVFGIDMALLVISASESVKEQTVEHLEILRISNTKKILVVLTKKDLVSKEILDKHIKESQLLIKRNGFDDANIICVNSHDLDDIEKLRKLIIFTEHKDTLKYVTTRLRSFFGTDESVVNIYGGMHRDERKKNQDTFKNNKDVFILVATDAASEGINLQFTNMMINYDLPWNPNRIEQRFGRIHRIGQELVCHLWNLVAHETREGSVFDRLFEKLEEAREALGGKVFDVLGSAFTSTPLRDILRDAIRYTDDPQRKIEFETVVDHAMDVKHLTNLLEVNALTNEVFDQTKVIAIKEEMEKIILIEVPSKIYPELRKIFVFLFENSGFKDIKISEAVDFKNLYEMRKIQ